MFAHKTRTARFVAALSTVIFAFCGAPATAEELVLECEFVGPQTDQLLIPKVNQLVIDEGEPSVALRIAQTMGTSMPMDWRFGNNRSRGDVLSILRRGEKLVISAIRDGVAPYAMVLDMTTGAFMWAWADTRGTKAYHFRCHR